MLRNAERLLSAFEALLVAGAVACISCIAILASLDAILRYLVSYPIGWVHDFVSLYLMVGSFALVLSGTFAANGHMGVDLFVTRLSERTRRAFAVVSDLLGVVLFVPIAYVMLDRSLVNFANGSVLSGEIPWPTWPPAALLAFGCLVLVLRLSLHAGQMIAGQTPATAIETSEAERWN